MGSDASFLKHKCYNGAIEQYPTARILLQIALVDGNIPCTPVTMSLGYKIQHKRFRIVIDAESAWYTALREYFISGESIHYAGEIEFFID